MGEVLAGLLLFNAFFANGDYKYDTFEIADVNFARNEKSSLNEYQDYKKVKGFTLGSRDYDQISPSFRFGKATYIYGNKVEYFDKNKKFSQLGGYAGLLFEYNYKRYLGIGVVVGGGFNSIKFNETQKNHFFGVATPYINLGIPLTKTASINFTNSIYYLSEPSRRIDGKGVGFEGPYSLERKHGIEFVWSWD